MHRLSLLPRRKARWRLRAAMTCHTWEERGREAGEEGASGGRTDVGDRQCDNTCRPRDSVNPSSRRGSGFLNSNPILGPFPMCVTFDRRCELRIGDREYFPVRLNGTSSSSGAPSTALVFTVGTVLCEAHGPCRASPLGLVSIATSGGWCPFR